MSVATRSSGSSNFGGLTNNPSIASVAAQTDDWIYYAVLWRATGGGGGANVVLSSAPTWNGQTMTLITALSGTVDTLRLSIYAVKASSNTTATITAAFDQYANAVAGYRVISGADTATPNGTPVTQQVFGTYSAPSVSVGSMTASDDILEFLGEMGWDSGFGNTSAGTWTAANSQTSLFNQASSSDSAGMPQLLGATKTGSGSVTVGYTFSSGSPGYIHWAARIIAATTSPTISAISDATPNYLGSLTITGTNFPTSQSGSAGITIGGVAQTVTWNTSTSCSIASIDIGTNKFGTSVDIIVTDASGNASTGYATTFSPRSGGASVDLSGAMASAGVRLVASPDIAAGDQIEYYSATGGTIPADVTVNNDGTYDTAAAVTGFYWRVWTAGGGWGAAAFETVDHAAVSSGDTGALFKTMMGSLFKTLLEAS